jgi:hypothetical protein
VNVRPSVEAAALKALAERYAVEVANHSLTRAQLAAQQAEIADLRVSLDRIEKTVAAKPRAKRPSTTRKPP